MKKIGILHPGEMGISIAAQLKVTDIKFIEFPKVEVRKQRAVLDSQFDRFNFIGKSLPDM